MRGAINRNQHFATRNASRFPFLKLARDRRRARCEHRHRCDLTDHVEESGASSDAQTCFARPTQNGSRNARFWILPLPVRGSSFKKSTKRGHL